MAELTWRETADGHASDAYLIRDLGPARHRPFRWCLEVFDLAAAERELRVLATSFHPSLGAAKAQAARDERYRVRGARVSGHLIVGIGALSVLVVVAAFDNLAAFLAVVTLMYVGLGSLADAYWIWMNDAWGTTKANGGPVPMSWSDRLLVSVIERRHRRRLDAARSLARPIRALPPQPFEVRAARVLSGARPRRLSS